MNYAHYSHVAELFDFPGPELAPRGRALLAFLRQNYPDAALEVEQFLDAIPERTLDLQELHTRTFDVQALTTLDIGYVLFGDDYKRGKLLSHLNREHNKAHNDCGTELADHLPNVLRLLSTWDHYELTQDFIQFILAPALRKMIGEFDIENLNSKEKFY